MKTIRKALALFLALIMLVSVFPVSAFAEETIASGSCGENLTWVLDDMGTLTISGTGAMEDYGYIAAPWYDYGEQIITVIIEDGVTTIGNYAFQYCDSLTSVTIHGSVTTIGEQAFSDCSALTSVTIPASVTTIGEQAFFGCRSLTAIQVAEDNPNYSSDSYGVLFNKEKTTLICCTGSYAGSYEIPDSVTIISDRAFERCTGLTSITIPDSVTTIGDYAFCQCDALTSITIPASVTIIGDCAFSGCSALTSVTISASVTTIGNYVFNSCYSLTSVIIPASVTTIGDRAFGWCDSLTDVYYTGTEEQWSAISVSEGNENLQNATIHYNFDVDGIIALGSCGENLTWVLDDTGTLTISGEGEMDAIYHDDFHDDAPWGSYKEQITTLVIEDGVTSIGDCTFWNCSSLADITIPDSVTSIGNSAFRECGEISSISLSTSVTSIGACAFWDCDNLTDVYYAGTAEQWESITINAYNDPLLNATIHLGDGSLYGPSEPVDPDVPGDAIASGTCGRNLAWVLGADGTLTISGTGAMNSYDYDGSPWSSYKSQITSLVLEDGITSISNYAFLECSSLTGDLVIPDSVTSIGSSAFFACGFTGTLTLSENLTSLNFGAFLSCSGFTGDLNIPASVTTIGDAAFRGMSGITSVTFRGSSVPSFGSDAFENMTSLTTAYVPADAYDLYVNALTDVLPDSVTIRPIDGESSDFVASGSCGENLTWVLDDTGTLIISGEGAMEDYGYVAAPWYDYGEQITTVIIEDGVTTIGDWAFDWCYSLTSITIPASVTTIGNYAFCNCDSLTGVTIPASVTSISNRAFSGCSELVGIQVAEDNPNYSSDGYGVLFNKEKTTLICCPGGYAGSYELPDGVTSIGDDAFNSCDALTSITIPDSVITIGDWAFDYCDALTSVIIPGSVTSIGKGVFSNCDALTTIQVAEDNPNYSSDNYGVLFNKEKTTLICCPGGYAGSYELPSSVTSIGWQAFCNCNSLTSVTIPGSVTTIGNYAFGWCDSLTSITIEDGVTSIGYGAFRSCTSLTSITIPDSVTTIGDQTFNWCDSLTSVTIPASVTTIGDYAFGYCDALTDVYYGGTEEQWSAISVSDGNEYLQNATIHYNFDADGIIASGSCGENLTWVLDDTGTLTISGEGEMEDYVCDNAPWYGYGEQITTVIIEDGVTSIGNYAFYFYSSLTGVTIPASVTIIGDHAFGCTALTSVTIPSSVTTIGDYAFYSCYSLTSITIPDSVTTIGDRAFYYCTSLTSITIPGSVTTIGNYAFFGCRSLTAIQVAEDNPNYSSDSYGVLFNKEKTTLICCPGGYAGDYEIPASVTTIGDGAFGECDALTGVTIPDSVTIIGNWAFGCCTSLTSITIPASVTTIGDWAFYFCYALTDVYYTGTEEQWSAISIGDNNEPLQNATIHYIVASGACGESLTWVLDDTGTLTISGEGAMEDYGWNDVPWYDYREQIITVIIEDGVTTIGDRAFYYCDSLTSVTISDSVTTIGDRAFYDCYSLTSIVIPGSITTIGNYAFGWCYSLTSITIPSSVTTIGYDAFIGCSELVGIQVAEDNLNYSSDSYGVLFNKEKTTLICCPGGYAGGYEIPDSVTTIGDDAFYSCDSLTSITIPASVTTIGGYAFGECHALTSITITDSVTTIGDGAFYYCTSLTSITIPGSVATIGNYAFFGCSALTAIQVAEDNPNYSSDSYGVLFNKEKTELICCPGGYAGGYEIPDGVTIIGGDAFNGCTSLTSITIPASVTTIGDGAFCWCYSLTSITIPTSVTTIGDYAFSDCYALTDVYYTGTEEQWSAISVGEGNENLQNATIHYGKTIDPPVLSIDNVDETGCIKLSWEAVNGAAKYYIYRSTDGGETYKYYGSTTKTTYTNTNVTPGTKYYYKVKAVASDATSVYSNVVCRTADCAKPSLSSSIVSSSGAIKLSWEAVNGAAKYYIYRSTDGGKTYKYYGSTTKTTYTDANVTPGTKYCYKIKAICSNTEGNSAYSNVVYRTADCAKPSLSSSIVSSSGAIKLSWEAVNGADKYYIYRSTDGGETYSYYASTTKTTYTNTSVTPGTTYYYKIRAICSNTEGNSAYSNVVYRTADCAKPSLSSSIVASSGAIKLSWEAVDGAAKYYIYRSTDGGETYKYYASTTKTSYTNANVTPGTRYYYKIKAICSNTDGNSAYSNVVCRTADCAKPSLSSSIVASNGAIKLSWEAVNGAAKYYIYRSTDSGETYSYYASTTKTTYTNTNVTPGTTYYYKIKAICSNTEGNSAYSNVVYRTADCAKPVVTIQLNGGKPQLKWSAIDGAKEYVVYRATSENGTYTKMYTTTKLSYTNTNAESGTTYYYKVMAICAESSYGNSAYSDVVSIKSE